MNTSIFQEITMFKKSLLALMVSTALVGCGSQTVTENADTVQIKEQQRQNVTQIIDDYTKGFMSQQPALATSLKLDNNLVGHYANQWPDYSPEGMKNFQQSMAKSSQLIANLDVSQLSASEKLHVAVNQVIADYYRGDLKFSAGYVDTWGGHLPYVVSQISGPLIDIPKVLQNQHVINNKNDAEDYLTRLEGLKGLIAAVKAKVLADAATGVVLPKALFPNTLGYLTNFIDVPVQEHGLVSHFADKVQALSDVSQAEKSRMVSKAADVLESEVYPAFQDIHRTMASLEAKAPETAGIWAQPGGEDFYKHEILYMADSHLSPEKIHQIGLDEVARIGKEMDAILKSQGMTEGSVGERMMKLVDMPQFVYEDSDEGRAALLASLNKEIENIMEIAPSLFATMPTQEVIVKRIPVVSQDGAPGGYYNPPSLDGSRPGEFAINLKDMKAQPSYSLKTLTYHEAVPGHHFQISLNMAQTDIGLMRQNGQFNAFVEGWALYSELVAYEMGLYENDPWGNLGRLQAEIYRAARLVVDTGLHYKRWTRQEAINYFAEATGTAMSDVEAAIDRYMAWPGQALGYKLGMLKMVELRNLAQKQLGDKFDIKAFHDLILLPGARPLTILEADVKRWIKQVKSA